MNESSIENHTGLEPEQDVDVLRCRIEQLEHREKELEQDFGLKRAKFKDLYLQKEEELGQRDRLLSTLQEEKSSLAEQVLQLQQDLDDARSLATVAECTKENEIEQERRKCAEEIASLQHIMKESVAEAERDWKSRYEKELMRFRKLEEELGELKGHYHHQHAHPPAPTATPPTIVHDKEGVLAVVTKSLKQKVGNLGGPNPFSGMSNENLEESMRKVGTWQNTAQEDAEMLRSLVLPLEEEIKVLKDKLRSTDEQLRAYEAAFSGLVKGLGSDALLDHMLNGKNPCEVVQHLDEKLTSLSQGLQAEKASRSDLEMYVAVLNTQKAVMQDDMERIKRELHEVCELLESEKREHVALKRTWQMANDQFLEAQRLQIQDMRRIQSVLSLEQQRQIMAMKKKDEAERRKTESPLHVPQEQKQQQHFKAEAKLSPHPGPSSSQRLDAVVQPSPQNVHLSLLKPLTPLLHRRLHSVDLNAKPSSYEDISKSNPENISWAGSDLRLLSTPSSSEASPLIPAAESSESIAGRVLRRTRSSSDLNDPGLKSLPLSEIPPVATGEKTTTDDSKDPAHLLLTRDQVNSLADLTPEQEARSTLLQSARAEHDSVSLVGKRLVSEKEWKLLEEELGRAREKLGQACQMCGNYELQLQHLQTEERDRGQQLKTANHTLDRYKEDLHREQVFREELEQKFTQATQEYETQVRDVFKKIEESEKLFSQIKTDFSITQNEALEQLKKLSSERDLIRKESNALVEDNDVLLGKHLSHSQDVSREEIDLPNCIEEMQFQYLRLREDHIVALERWERSQSEILILREQIQSEKQQREAVENMLSQEIASLRQNSVMSESLRVRSSALEEKLKLVQEELQKVSAENKAAALDYQTRIDRITQLKEQNDKEVYSLRSKVQSLQGDLDNSEVVQRDFVKLSQTLQIQLEKIRQADQEVRWQHEDDANDCGACTKQLTSRKEKHHCSHCGKIFCSECSTKTVPSGPKNRSYRVCNVCHTLLDHDVAPYFSCEPPQTPS